MDQVYLYLTLAIFFIHCLVACSAIAKTSITSDQNALLDLKNHVTFDPNRILEKNWSVESSVCEWIGVTCSSRHHRVTALDLSNMGLMGTIPPELGNLSFLVSLNLSRNSFYGHLPFDLSHLHRLKVLDLRVNNLTGDIPLWLDYLLHLQVLILANNSFTGSIPSSISNLSNLETLWLSFNPLQGIIPVEIGNLQYLKLLRMNFNQLSGSLPVEIFNVSSLEEIGFGGNTLSGTLPTTICKHLSKLNWLGLSGNQMYGPIPTSISQCTKLQILDLSFNNFIGSMPKEIGNLKVLEELYLDKNNLEGVIPKEIGNLTLLRKLNFQYNHLTGIIPKEIGSLTALQQLSLDSNNLTGGIPQEFGRLYKLQFFDMSSNALGGSIPIEIFNLSTIRMIQLFNCSLSGSLPFRLGVGLPNLEEIYLGLNSLSGVIPHSISNSSKLYSIDFGSNNFMGPIPHSFGNLRLLENLNLESNNLSRDPSTLELEFITSLANCKYLKYLWISENPLNGILPSSIGNLSTSLESIDAGNCKVKGIIPCRIGNLSQLISLDLSGNQLTGTLPAEIDLLQNLQVLKLMNNKLSGVVLENLCTLQRLAYLYLSGNRISGPIPKYLENLTSLIELFLDANKLNSHVPTNLWNIKGILKINFSSNNFQGSLTPEVGSLKVATIIDLSMNNFSGDIPQEIGSLQMLSYFSLAHNKLQGHIPERIGGMLNLESLDLSDNNFSGSIPKSLVKLQFLRYFNVSFNKLEGEIPSEGPFKNFTYESFIFNEGLCGAHSFHVPPCPKRSTQTIRRKRFPIKVFVLLGMLTIRGVMALGVVYLIRRKKDTVLNETNILSVRTVERISYYQLHQATNGYDERNLLGIGSFGCVYRGTLNDGRMLAIKVFNLQLEGAFKSFDIECHILCNLRHRNLTRVICSCSNTDFKALILEFMPNGSLEKWLHSHNFFLSMKQRLNILIDVACALEYLHLANVSPVVHSDLKPSNVLLDQEMVAHVCDFGIAKILGQEGFAYTNTLATFGYIAPEYGLEGLVSTKCDIYSFGIMMMEVFTRRRPSDEMFGENLSLKDWVNNSMPSAVVEVIDSELLNVNREDYIVTMECISMIMDVAMSCSTESPKQRCNIGEVLTALNKIKLKLRS